MAEKNYLKALKFLKKAYACPDGKKDIDLILDLAFLYDKIADFNSAEKMYKMALDIDNTCAIAYYGLGIIYDDDESYEEAIECYKKAIENDNKYEKAYFFLANAYDELGNK
ncbi:tetratricopeptide repeat protein [Clostridium sp. 29_15]|uniref:tetratricopeptide repeat protein n=1 Tax=Clostridium sp. 29_15 TaxID=1896982 RepID=UPI000AE4636A